MGKLVDVDTIPFFLEETGAVVAYKADIDQLSSAQPEIIRCKECKHWEYDVIFAEGWCRGKQQGNPEWFCADAERRTDK